MRAKILVGMIGAVITVSAIGVTVLASNTNSYTWRGTRKSSYCSTEFRSVDGLYCERDFQTFASSVGSSDGERNSDEKDSYKRTVLSGLPSATRVKDSRTTVSATYHNSSLDDGYGWTGQSMYVTGSGSVDQTRNC